MNYKDIEALKFVEAIKTSQEDPLSESFLCPRCGRIVDNSNLQKLVMSRYAEINICSVCGIEETMLDDILPLHRWSHAKSLEANRG